MTWFAKPRGGYDLYSTELYMNTWEAYNQLTRYGFSRESIIGILGNAVEESGMNPWRWQYDRFNTSNGYGLFQFTPATNYVYRQNSKSNLSITTITANASVDDAVDEIIYLAEDRLGKWKTDCWRSYWDRTLYSDLWVLRTKVLNKYGTNDRITLEQFKKVNEINDAIFIFLACYEGPLVPDMADRMVNANRVNDILGGTPPPPTKRRRKMPLYMMLRF